MVHQALGHMASSTTDNASFCFDEALGEMGRGVYERHESVFKSSSCRMLAKFASWGGFWFPGSAWEPTELQALPALSKM